MPIYTKQEINQLRRKRERQDYLTPELWRLFGLLVQKGRRNWSLNYWDDSRKIRMTIKDESGVFVVIELDGFNPEETVKFCRFLKVMELEDDQHEIDWYETLKGIFEDYFDRCVYIQ